MTASQLTATGARSARRRRPVPPAKRRSNLLTVIVWITMIYFLVPLIWLFISTTKDNSDLFATFGLAFGKTFEFFANIGNLFTFQDGVFVQWLGNTLLYAVTGAVGAAALATACGYALAKYRFRGRGLVFGLILGSIMVPLTALAIPTYLLFTAANITDSVWAIILPSFVSPFGVYLMRVYAEQSVDSSLLEAARIDGAGEVRTFFTVALRLLAPGIVTTLLFAVVSTWNNYFLPLIMLSKPNLYPLTVGLTQWSNQATGVGARPIYNLVITGSLLTIVPLVIAFLLLQRFWQSGLSAGSVK